MAPRLLLMLLTLVLSVDLLSTPERYFFQVEPGQLELWKEIAASDVQVLIGGQPQPALEARLIGPEDSVSKVPAAARLFLVYFDPGLGFREDFRSRRWVKRLVRELDPGRDFVAIHRSGTLSHFSSDQDEIQQMVDFYGTEFDRFEFGPGRVKHELWFQRPQWPFGPVPSDGNGNGPSTAQLLRQEHRGELRDVVSSLRLLPGRKILLYFGRSLPFSGEHVEFHDTLSSLRWAQDVQILVYAIVPGPGYETLPPAEPSLKTWVEATGGSLLHETDELLLDFRKILERTSHYFVVTYDALRNASCRFRAVSLRVAAAGAVLTSQGGYFDTVQVRAPLHERVFLTAARNPGRFQGLPLELKAEPTESRGLRIELRFPLEQVRFQPVGGSSGLRLFQEVHLFVGLYGDRDELLDYVQDSFEVDLQEEEIRDFFPRNASLKRVMESRRRAKPTKARAVVVVGQNRQISTKELILPRDWND